MKHVYFTFDADLRFFLTRHQKQQTIITDSFDWRGSV
jgi:hypothetical protein